MRCASFVWSGGSKHKVSLLAKTKNMSALASTYRIVYHTILSFRACPIQLILHDADASYVIEPPTWEPKRCLNPNTGYPVFAPPVLVKGEFSISQTAAIMQYLGQVHGYHASLVNPESLGTANQLLLDAADVGSELFGLAKDAGKKADFCKAGGRLHNWLKHLNEAHTKTPGSYLMGETPVPADFMLLAAFETLDYCVGGDVYAPILPRELSEWLDAMKKRSCYTKYKATDPAPALFASMKAGTEQI